MTQRRTIALIALAGLLAACGGPSEPAQHPAPPPLAAEAGPSEPSSAPAAASREVAEAFDAIQAEDFEKAKRLLTAARAQHPKDAQAAFLLGVASEKTGDAEAATALYREALALDPKHVDAAVYLSALLLDAGDGAGCVSVVEQGLAADPKQRELTLNRALCLDAAGDAARAAPAYAAAIAVAPDDPSLRLAYADALFRAGQTKNALAELDRIESGGEDVLISVASLYGKFGEPAKCIAALEPAILGKPSPALLVRRGLCRHELKDAKGERADYEAALKLDPKSASAHYYLGLFLRAAGKRAEAKAELEQAVAAAGDSALGKAARKALAELGGKK